MMRNIFLSLFALLAYTTAMVYEPEQQGYKASEANALSELIARQSAAHDPHKAWSAARKRAALQELGWEVADK